MIKRHRIPAEIFDRLERLASVLKQDQRVIFAYLFGGLASGVQKPLSDVDIAVFLDPACVNAETKLDLIGQLTDTLGTDEVDLVILNTAPISLVGRILKQKKLLADNQPFQRHQFESLKMREFFDFRRLEQAILDRRFAGGR
ncbi:MAG: nucleotidyltransferase domain-containing protein [Geobacter sp.]|nr:nucleotidyltransferase domain-containing protein [Geobacter sp.]